jgi:hypothetical protein
LSIPDEGYSEKLLAFNSRTRDTNFQI